MNTVNAGQLQLSVQLNMDQVADIHMCGMCKAQFTSLDAFLSHKRCGCLAKQNHCLITSLLNNTPAIPLPLPGAMITPATTTLPPGTPSRALSVKQRRKPILLSTSAKATQPAVCTPSQPCGTSTSVGSLTDSLHLCSPELPKASGNVQASFPIIAEDTARVTLSAAVQETRTGGSRSLEGKGKRASKAKCYKCSHESCGFETAHLKDIIRHRRIHTGDRPFTCSICQRRFTRKDKLQLHVRGHNGHKPFVCHQCPYAAVDSGSLKKHMRTHTKERPFKCQICTYASRNSSQLATHLRTHTGDTPFHCSLCSAKFKISTDLRRHERIHTGEKPFKCSLCPYASALNSNLKSHVKHNHFEEKKYKCQDCTYTFCTKKQLRQHERTHPSHSPVECLQCNVLCKNLRAYNRHERSHKKEKNPKCPHCSFTARYHSQIPPHIKKSHPDLPKHKPKRTKKAVKCKRVGQQSKAENKRKPRPSTVQVSGKKPFTCDKCQASFMRKDSFMSHMRQHEQVTKSMESTALAVLQLQELPTLPTTGATPTIDATANTTNQNQNNSSLFNELNPITPPTDFEMLLSVINSHAPPHLISSDPVPIVNAGNLSQKPSSKNATKTTSSVLPGISNSAVALPNWTRISASSTNGINASAQPHSITIIQPDVINGETVTLQVISRDADGQIKAGTPDKVSSGFNLPGQQLVLGQFPVVRNQLQLPQPSTVHAVQPTSQQLAATCNSVRTSSSHMPLPGSLGTPHAGFLPQSNRSPFPVPRNDVCHPSPTRISHPQKVFDPTSTQGLPHQQTVSPISQSLARLPYVTLPFTHNILQANVGQPRQPNTSATSSTPPMNQAPPPAQQSVYSTINQIETGTPQSQSHTEGTASVQLTPTNNVQTLTKYASWSSPINTTQMGPLQVMSQHQLQGNARQQNGQHCAAAGAAVTQSAGVRRPLLANAVTQQVVPHMQQGPMQQQQHMDQMKKQPAMFPNSNTLHVPRLAAACDNAHLMPSVIGDVLNVTSLGVRTQGAIGQATHPGTTSSI